MVRDYLTENNINLHPLKKKSETQFCVRFSPCLTYYFIPGAVAPLVRSALNWKFQNPGSPP
jgi:hypothetical protein